MLGVQLDKANDELEFDTIDTTQYASTSTPPKRSLLKISEKIFDPLGSIESLCHNIEISQQLCIEGIDWDKELQGEY